MWNLPSKDKRRIPYIAFMLPTVYNKSDTLIGVISTF